MVNLSEIKVSVSLESILHAPLINAWDLFCEKYGYNQYCINEGLADGDDKVMIELKDAHRYGLIKNDLN